MGERLVRNEEAGGSSPLPSTNLFHHLRIMLPFEHARAPLLFPVARSTTVNGSKRSGLLGRQSWAGQLFLNYVDEIVEGLGTPH